MTKKIFLGCAIFLITFSYASYAKLDNAPQRTIHLDRIIAIVNGDVITQNELNKKMELFGRQFTEAKISASELRKRTLDSMIDTLLQLQMAERNRMKVSDTELDGIITNIAKNNNITVEQLKKSLQEHENLDFKEYREQMRDQILIGRLQQRALAKDIVISDEEVEKILRNPPKSQTASTLYHTLDILVATPDNASSDQIKIATKTVTEIATKLKQGKDIEKLIQEYDATGQQVSNIDLGWRKIDELPNLFAKEIIKLGTGQISNPIQAPNGVHLLKLAEVRGMKPQKFNKQEARAIAFQQKLQERVKTWVAKDLRESAYIKIIE